MSHQSLKLLVSGFMLRVIVTNVILFQRIDLRDNCLKVAGLMALALSLKVNTSITQLDLDNVPKKKMVCIPRAHCSLTWITKLIFVFVNPVVHIDSSFYSKHIFKDQLLKFLNPGVWDFGITHFSTIVSGFHGWFHCIKMRPCGSWVIFPHARAVMQITFSTVNLYLSLTF